MLTLAVGGCNTNSSVDFKGARKDIANGLTNPYSAIGSGQGGVMNATTTSGYKVNVSLGTPVSAVKATTANNYDVRLNTPGKTSQSFAQ
jgi:hypothetical protein